MLKHKNSKFVQKRILKYNLNKKKKNFKFFSNDIGIIACQNARISENTLKSINLRLMRLLKKRGKTLFRRHPIIPVSYKAKNARMGKGKGTVQHYTNYTKIGYILFEIKGIHLKTYVKNALYQIIKYKIPLKSKIVKKTNKFLN